MTNFVNGYLPVVALLCLILILPLIFQLVALKYERRKTYSDVQRSMLSRYFYYQLVNIYITVTAGSLWRSLADILDHPSNLFQLLGESLPSMVGYFVALLVTKILGGLPIVFLRVGALSRMLFLRTLSSHGKLTQRELDEIYRPENGKFIATCQVFLSKAPFDTHPFPSFSTSAIWMGVPFAAIGNCNCLYVRRDLSSNSSRGPAIFPRIAHCI